MKVGKTGEVAGCVGWDEQVGMKVGKTGEVAGWEGGVDAG